MNAWEYLVDLGIVAFVVAIIWSLYSVIKEITDTQSKVDWLFNASPEKRFRRHQFQFRARMK